MMDKEKLHQLLSSLWKNDDSIGKTYYNQALQDVQTAIDLQEEPKKCMYSKDDYTDEDRKVLCDGCEEECKYSENDDFTKALAECIHQAQCNVVDPMVLAETWKDELIKLAQSEEYVSKEWIKELQEKLDSLSKEDFKKVWAKYSRYGEEGSVDYNKLITMLNDALSKETKESWNKRLGEEPVSKVWYDASEEPKSDKDIAVVTREGCMWSRYKLEDLDRGWKQFVNDSEIDKWAYVSDLINL